MRSTLLTAITGLFIFSANVVFAETGTEKKEDPKNKSTGHCELTKADGTEEDIEAKDKADCKAKGGKWSKKAKGDHDHK